MATQSEKLLPHWVEYQNLFAYINELQEKRHKVKTLPNINPRN